MSEDEKDHEKGKNLDEESSPPLDVWNLLLMTLTLLSAKLFGVVYAIFKFLAIREVIGVMNNYMQRVHQEKDWVTLDKQFEDWTFLYQLALVLCSVSMGTTFVFDVVALILNWKPPRCVKLVYISILISVIVFAATFWISFMLSDDLQRQIAKTLFETAEHSDELFAKYVEGPLQCSGYHHPNHKDAMFPQSDDLLQSHTLMAKLDCIEMTTGSVISKLEVIVYGTVILVSIVAVLLSRRCYSAWFTKRPEHAVQQTTSGESTSSSSLDSSVTQPPEPSVTQPPEPSVTQPPEPSVTQPPEPSVTQPPERSSKEGRFLKLQNTTSKRSSTSQLDKSAPPNALGGRALSSSTRSL